VRRPALLALIALATWRAEGQTLRDVLSGDDGPTAEEALGRDLVEAHGCGTCHVIPTVEGADGLTGPPLTAMARQAYVAGVLPNTPEALARFVMDPQAVDPRSAMPDLGLDAGEAAAIAAFLYAAGGG
jgi:mono/diheme cytochrome c family protein